MGRHRLIVPGRYIDPERVLEETPDPAPLADQVRWLVNWLVVAAVLAVPAAAGAALMWATMAAVLLLA